MPAVQEESGSKMLDVTARTSTTANFSKWMKTFGFMEVTSFVVPPRERRGVYMLHSGRFLADHVIFERRRCASRQQETCPGMYHPRTESGSTIPQQIQFCRHWQKNNGCKLNLE